MMDGEWHCRYRYKDVVFPQKVGENNFLPKQRNGLKSTNDN